MKVPRIDVRRCRAFQRRLLAWYRRSRRDLPWRRTSDPYHILVSEIMLQQTQVDRVIPKYHEFLHRYPSLEDLARARVDEVREVWYPLGYNVRPYRLHAIARQVVLRHGGQIPDDEGALRRMKGIGRYTAGAVLSFAYRKAAPVVDTNVRRVLQRVFLGVKNGGHRARGTARNGAEVPRRYQGQRPRRTTEAVYWSLARELLPRRRAYDFNQALMDFGAMVCTARRPRCPACPLRDQCASYPAPSPATDGTAAAGPRPRGVARPAGGQ